MFYSGGVWFKWDIGYATSTDKITWTKDPYNPVLEKGAQGSWDDYFVAVYTVLIDTVDSLHTMWYGGGNQEWDAHIGYATSLVTSINDDLTKEIPYRFVLSQNYPNPFNPSTTIEFSVPKSEYVEIEVFNLLGQKVATLVKQKMSIGFHEVLFEAQDLPSSVYVYKISASQFQDVKKMLLLK